MRLGRFVLLGLLASGSEAGAPLDKTTLRKTTPSDVVPRFERVVLANGLIVLLSPDTTSFGVAVDVSFFAGTLFEPPGKSGLAHLVEHVLSNGPTPDTNYQRLLEARGAADFNAFTGPDLMTFHVALPSHELPLALWVATDRLATVPALVDEAHLERSRRIVGEERAIRVDDVPYQPGMGALIQVMFPSPHPLHDLVIGAPAQLASVTVRDVRTFAHTYLVPANGLVTITGNFDVAVARGWLDQTLGQLPAGTKATAPQLPGREPARVVTTPEPRSRRPRVTFAWRFGELSYEVANALDVGAVLLQIYTDGLLGMSVDVSLDQFLGGSMFMVAVTLDHESSKQESYENAEALLRYLTRATSQDDIFGATLLAKDRAMMAALDAPMTRAALLTRLEALLADPDAYSHFCQRHWDLMPWDIPAITRKFLDQGRFTLHSRPLNPRPQREQRE